MRTTVTISIGVTNISANMEEVDTWRNKQNNIGQCRLLFENPDNVYGGVFSSNDAISITVDDGAAVEIWTGFVDDVKPFLSPRGVYTNKMEVTGSDRGRYGADLYVTAKYEEQDMDEIIEKINILAGTPWTWADPGATPDVKYECRRTFLSDAVREICDLSDPGYDSYITNPGVLTIFPAGTDPSGVALLSDTGDVTSNLLSFEEYEQVAKGIRNYIEVSAGSVKDHYTEENAVTGWTAAGAGAVRGDDTAKHIWGEGSIYLDCNGAVSQVYLDFSALKYGYLTLDLSKPCQAKVFLSAERDGAVNVTVRPFMTDGGAHTIRFYRKAMGSGSKGYTELVPDWTAEPKWNILTYPLGDTCVIKAAQQSGFWYGDVAFDWTDVEIIGFEYDHTDNGEVWIDGWTIPSLDAKDIVEDAGGGSSQALYDKRMFHKYKKELKSLNQITAYATRLLTLKKDPVQKFKAVAKGQTGSLYAAQTVTVEAPQHGIGVATKYIITKLHHKVRKNAITRGFDFTTTYDLVIEETLASRISDNQMAERLASLLTLIKEHGGGMMDEDILIGDAETGTQTAVETGAVFPLDPNNGDLFDLTDDLTVGASEYYGPARYWYDETLGDWYRNPMTMQRVAPFAPAGGEVAGDKWYDITNDLWYRWTGAWTLMPVAAGSISGEVAAGQLAIEQRDWHSNLNFIWDVANKDWDEIWWGLTGNEAGADAQIEFSDGTTHTITRGTEAALADGTYIYYWNNILNPGGPHVLVRDTFANWDNGVGAGKGIVFVVVIDEAGANPPSFYPFNSYMATVGVGMLSAWTVKTHHLTAEEIYGKDIATQTNVGIAAGNAGIRIVGDASDLVTGPTAIGDAIGGNFTAGIWGFAAGPVRTFHLDPATGVIWVYGTGLFGLKTYPGNVAVGYVDATIVDLGLGSGNQNTIKITTAVADQVLMLEANGIPVYLDETTEQIILGDAWVNMRPMTDGNVDLGTNLVQFGDIWGTVKYSDLNLLDTHCPNCDKLFKKGENVKFVVTAVETLDGSEGTTYDQIRCVPAHVRCSLWDRIRKLWRRG